ncbi:MAG: BON domain-containing protein [Methylobacter sp.]|nr:BON domain-containing protein [Methylobacter sp.]
MKTKNLADRVLVVACISAALGLAGCQPEGSAEKAGKKVDSAVESAEKSYDLAASKVDKKAQEAKELLSEEAENVSETINETTDASKEALEKTEKNIEESVTEKTETTGQYIDDTIITAKVKAAILKDPLLSASRIEVTTDKGVVKLSGTVDSEKSISRAMEVAGGQENVKSVQSDLTVNASATSKE